MSNILQKLAIYEKKKCQIVSFQDVQNGRDGTKFWAPPPARLEHYCESKQTYFSYSLDKAFHSPEFQAKLSGQFLLRQPLNGFAMLLLERTFWILALLGSFYSAGRVLSPFPLLST